MSGRTLTIVLAVALALSVALNLFAATAGVTALVTRARIDERVEEQRRPGRGETFRDIVAAMDPEVRDQVRQTLRASALAARPDFEEARASRRQAIALAEAATLDQAAVDALLERSRVAELRGRQRLEIDSVALLATLGPEDREALAVILDRHGRGGRGGRDRRPRNPENARLEATTP